LFNQPLLLRCAHRIIPLEYLHGLVPAGGHDPEVIVPLKPPIDDGGVPQVEKREVLDLGIFAD
jgi:hypothetical protein